MKNKIILLALWIVSIQLNAQTDTMQVENGTPVNEEREVVKEGLFFDIEQNDTTKKDPFVFETRRKKFTITSEPKPWTNVEDSVASIQKKLRQERRRMFTYWSGLDLGVNTLLGEDGDADLSGDAEFMEINNARSRFFAINFAERKLEFGSHHAGIYTG
ncbi:MAG: hypothetical protein M3R08_12225, partial [Bacteroidota bacterium]|nr:hypothetical protein [Bacteroidota bacterium]